MGLACAYICDAGTSINMDNDGGFKRLYVGVLWNNVVVQSKDISMGELGEQNEAHRSLPLMYDSPLRFRLRAIFAAAPQNKSVTR